jgi:hypothetical protein
MQNGRASRCRARLTRPSAAEQFANVAARNRFAAQSHLVDNHFKAHLLAQLSQQIHVARRLVPEAEVVAFVHFARTQLLLQNAFGKLPRRHQRKIAAKRKHQHRVDAGVREPGVVSRGPRGQQFQSGIRPQNPRGMRLKRDRYGLGAGRPRPPHQVAQHVRVRPVHAVKVADADQRRPVVRGNVFEFVKNLHKPTSDLGLQTSD